MAIARLWLLLLLHVWIDSSDAQGFGMNLLKVPTQDRTPIACTVGLLGKYFRSGESLSGSIVYVTTTMAANHIQKLFLQALHDDTDYPWSIVVKDGRRHGGDAVKSTEFILQEKPQCYFIVIESIEDENMDDIFEMWKSTVNWNPLAQFVVFLSTIEETEEEMTDVMVEVLHIFMDKKIFNVNVVGQAEESQFVYGKTVFPYHPDNNCGNRVITIETLDKCDYLGDVDEKADDEEEEEGEIGNEDVKEVDKEEKEDDDGEELEEHEETNETGVDAVNNDEEMEVQKGSGESVNAAGVEAGNNDGEMEVQKGSGESVNAAGVEAGNNDGEMEVQKGSEEEETETGISLAEKTTEYKKEPEAENPITGTSLEVGDEKTEVQKDPEDGITQSDRSFEEPDKLIEVQEEPEAGETESDKTLEGTEKNETATELEEKSKNVYNDTKKPPENEVSETHEYPATSNEMSFMNNTPSSKISGSHVENDMGVETTLNTFSVEEAPDIPQTSITASVNEIKKIERGKPFGKKGILLETTSTTTWEEKVETTNFDSIVVAPEKEAPQIEFLARSNLKTFSSDPHRKSLPYVENENSKKSKLHIEEMYRALFLDKIPRDLSGCPLIAAYRPWEPYIFHEVSNDIGPLESYDNNTMYNDEGIYEFKSYDEPTDWGEDNSESPVESRLNGIEYKMIQTIEQSLHISIKMHVENTNVYQLFQQLIDGGIELVIGGIDEDPIISQYVSSTIPYQQDDLTWCVAKARQSYNLFNFVATFDPRAWILTFLFIQTASFSIRMSQRFLKFRIKSFRSYFAVAIHVMGTILSQSLNLRPLPTSLKVSFGTIFFMSLMFTNIYQSFLVSTLTTPKTSYQISHTQEIYENRMHVMGSVDNVRHLNKEGETFRYVREQFQMCYNIEECLQRTAMDAKMAMAVSRLHSFYNPRIPRDHLYCFDRNENIYVYLVTMLLPKKFHLLHKINPVIQYIIESGHMQKWARDLDMRRKITEAIHRAHEEKFKSLQIVQVIGPFAFIGVLLLHSTLVFALECTVHWLVVRRRTRLKIAKYLHRKFV